MDLITFKYAFNCSHFSFNIYLFFHVHVNYSSTVHFLSIYMCNVSSNKILFKIMCSRTQMRSVCLNLNNNNNKTDIYNLNFGRTLCIGNKLLEFFVCLHIKSVRVQYLSSPAHSTNKLKFVFSPCICSFEYLARLPNQRVL